MERRKAEERQNILKRKVIQKLYNPEVEENHFLKICGNGYAPNAISTCKSNEHQNSVEPVAKAFKADTDSSYDLKPTREEKSISDGLKSSSEVDLNKNGYGAHEKIINNIWNGDNTDKLSPYLSDDEDSEEKSIERRKRKRRHHHLSANPRLSKRSSSSSSASSQVHRSEVATPHPLGLSSRLTQNHRRKLKRKRRKRDRPIEKSQGVVYTFKSNI